MVLIRINRDLVMEVPLYELDDLDNYQYIKKPEKPKVKPSRDDSDDSKLNINSSLLIRQS